MYKKILFLLIFISYTSLSASLFGDDEEVVVIPTHTIEIHGEKYFEENSILDAVSAEYPSKYAFWNDTPPQIKDKLLPTLNLALRAFFDSEGFYDATYDISVTDKTVKINIKENKPVKVNDIEINSDFNISNVVTFKKGEIFKAKDFINIKGKIAQELLKEGYCSYELDTKAYVDLEKYSVNLKYNVKKGGVCTFGDVTVVGTKTMSDDVIKSRVRAKKGDRFSTELVKDTSDALYGLQAFDSVLIGVDRKFYNVVPVDISVAEMQKPYHFTAGAGYDTYVGPRVHTSVTKHNFMGEAQQLKLELAWSKLEQLAILSFYRPVLFNISGYYIGVGAKLGYSNLEYDGFKEEKAFARAYLDYQNKKLSVKAGFAAEPTKITALDNISKGDQLNQAVNEGTFNLIYPYIDIVYDARNSKLNPTNGYYLAAYFETGLSADDDASIYYKYLLEARIIHSFGDLTLAAVVKNGIVDENSEKGLPESKYFFAGGSFSNRAYGFRELGLIVSPTEDTINGAHTWLNLSLEADYPIWGDLYGALFTDNTMLTAEAYDFSGDVITSAGLGVRYLTPIGPFKLDVGMNVQDIEQYRISFQIGQSF